MKLRTVILAALVGMLSLTGCGQGDSLQAAEAPNVTPAPIVTTSPTEETSGAGSRQIAESDFPEDQKNSEATTAAPTSKPVEQDTKEEVTSLDFLTKEQQSIYLDAVKLSVPLFGSPDNFVYVLDVKYSSADGVSVDLVNGGYALTETPYEDVVDRMLQTFTEPYLRQTDFYNKCIDYNGKLAFKGPGQSPPRGYTVYTVENFPDTYCPGEATDDSVSFTLIAHYQESDEPEDPEGVVEKAYPIHMTLTENGWRIDEFHSTQFG